MTKMKMIYIQLMLVKLGSIADDIDKNVSQLKEINPELSGKLELEPGDLINTEYNDIRTHDAIRNLRSIFKFHSFLGYTATPNANLLTNTFNFLSPSFSQILEPVVLHWVRIFLDNKRV